VNKTILHKAGTRGRADLGWLVSNQSFSFADYYDPERMGFGALRVLNDDLVAGGRGFGSHPHDNMEIISLPLEGSLVHEDNMGNRRVVGAGEIQIMSTGRGVFHSEYNNDPLAPVKFLQIWVFPNLLNVVPRYDQRRLDREKGHNRLQPIVSPGPDGEGAWIYQEAWFHLGSFDAGARAEYRLKKEGNGVYLFLIGGAIDANGIRLESRDGLGITGDEPIRLEAVEPGSELLVIEVPVKK